MPTIQTIVFEKVEIELTTKKQLFIHPIHRILAEEFPITVNLAVLSCAYDLPVGSYTCKHTLLASDKRKALIAFSHEAMALDKAGGGMGYRTTFENVRIEAPGRYWIRTELSGGLKGDDIVIRVEGGQKPAARLNMRG